MGCYCDYDPSDIWDEKIRKARKEHTCAECNNTINVGEEYTDIAQLSDGSWDHFRLCEFCTHDWRVARDAGHCFLIGGLAETWEDMWAR